MSDKQSVINFASKFQEFLKDNADVIPNGVAIYSFSQVDGVHGKDIGITDEIKNNCLIPINGGIYYVGWREIPSFNWKSLS